MKLARLVAVAALATAVVACSSGAQPTESPSAAPTQLATPEPSPTASASAAPASSAPAASEYKIKRGDTLYAIAKRNAISLDVLLAANPQIKDPDKLKIGQVIYIPAR